MERRDDDGTREVARQRAPASSIDGVDQWLKDPAERFAAAFEPKLLRMGAVSVVVVALLVVAINRLLLGTYWTGGVEVGLTFLAVTLAAALSPYWTAARITPSNQMPSVYWGQASAQLLWLALAAWISHPAIGLVVVLLYLSAVVNDTRYLYDTPRLQAHYVVTLVPIAVVLLALEAFESGPLSRFESDRTFVLSYGVVVLFCAGMALFIVRVVGQKWRQLDAQLAKSADLSRRLAATAAENAAIRQASAFLEQGILAGRFTHDVSSPISTLKLGIRQLQARDSNGDGKEPLLDLMQVAVTTLSDQTQTLANAIRGTGAVESWPIERLVDEAVEYARRTGARLAEAEHFPLQCELAAGAVRVTDQHVGALADIISNGVRASPKEGVALQGQELDGLYRLTVRDFGTPIAEQPAVVEKISAILADGTQTNAKATSGLGIGMVIAKLTFIRFGGQLSATIPGDGPGVAMCVDLATSPPAEHPQGNLR